MLCKVEFQSFERCFGEDAQRQTLYKSKRKDRYKKTNIYYIELLYTLSTSLFRSEETYIGVGRQAITKEEGRHFINITKIFFYPGFNPKTFENDIMLLKVNL